MGGFKLKSKFKPTGDQPEAIKQLVDAFTRGKKKQTLLGVTGSGKTFTMANIIAQLGKKALILAPNKTLAAQLFSEFREFFPENAVEYFVSYYDYYQPEAYVPGSDTYIEKDSSINDEIDKLKHSATRSLLERDDVIVVASVSCIYGIGSPDEYLSHRVSLYVDDECDRDELIRELVSMQYTRNDIDFSRGTFRVRGDVLEVFPAHEDSQVIRIEFFDDLVEGIFLVDPLRGKILQDLKKTTIYPSSHYVVGKEKLKVAMGTIQEELRERINYFQKENKLVEKQRIEQRTLLDLEMLDELGYCNGIENYSRHITASNIGDPPPTLIDYFGDDFIMIIDESHIAVSQVGGMFRGDRARKMNLVDFGFRLPSALDNRPLNFDEFESKIDQTLYVSATPGDYELSETGGEYVEQIIRPTGLLDPLVEVRSANTQVDDLLIESKKVISSGFRVLVTTLTKKMAEELTNFYKGAGLKVRYLHSDIDTLERMEILRDLRLGEFDILVGINLLREGLDLPEVALVAILDADKEGFLRSIRSLIQTIGRAARNSEGRVILYANKMTKSMEKAIYETKRRREIQTALNEKEGIVPATVIKEVSGGIIDVLSKNKKAYGHLKNQMNKNKEVGLSPGEIDSKIKDLKNLMKAAAKDLRFEEAAQVRDEIKLLEEARLIL
ncbi:MAG: excinuclease ABC subunit UvrB [Bacteriovoracaceae bacterium]|nr:excinuclease ABC subunit UvrB [Bacteriovoracaceae bacterium]